MRTFVGIDLPENMRGEIQKMVEALRLGTAAMRALRPEGMHITLKFIGEISPEKVEQVKQSLNALPAAGAIPIAIRGSGFHIHTKGPCLFWLGVEAGPELASLARRIEEELARRLDIPKEDRAFRPHVTFARGRANDKLKGLQEMLTRRGPIDLGEFIAEEYFLYQSVLSPGGSIYSKLARFPLAK